MRRTTAGTRLQVDHRHDELEFDLVVKGAGSFTLDERSYELKPGTLIWLVPGQQHRLARSPQLEMWVVTVRPEQVEPEWLAEFAAEPLRLLPGQELIELDRLLSQVTQDSDEPATYNAGIAYLLRRARRASRDSPPANNRPMHPAVARALLRLRESGAATSLSELASDAGVAAPYLSRLLIEHTGRSFIDWRNRIRLDRFMDGYRPGANLLSVALEAGFGSYVRFNHVFNEMIGCAPSEWAKQADEQGGDRPIPVLAAGYGIPSAGTLSARQRWIALVPLVSPAIGALLGKDFLDRLLAAAPSGMSAKTSAFTDLEDALSDQDWERLIASLRALDPARAEDLVQLLGLHDFAGTHAGILGAFGLSATRFLDAVSALVTVTWVAATGAADPAPDQAAGVTRQMQGALGGMLARLAPRKARDAHCALLCHFVVVYRALEAARASGDPRALEQLAEAARHSARSAFDGDITKIELTQEGFRRARKTPAAVRNDKPRAGKPKA